MLFLNVYAYALLLGGPMVAHYVGTSRRIRERWHVMAFCAAGGAAGAIVLNATLLLTDVSSFAVLRPSLLRVIGMYALVGLGMGLVSVVTPASVRHRLLVTCAKLATQTWRHRGQVLLAMLGGLLIQTGGAWVRSRLFPPPSIYVHVDAPWHSARTTRLPDESQVILAPGSHLSYTSWFAPHDERELSLNGEGRFSVGRGAREALTLEARDVEVSASNARFTVHAYDAEPFAYVIVQEGLVRLRARPANGFSKVLTLSGAE